MLIHSQEGLLQAAGALQQRADYDQYRQLRVVAEHRLARLEQLGIRRARYFGLVKTKFQLYLAATMANLTYWPTKPVWSVILAMAPTASLPPLKLMSISA